MRHKRRSEIRRPGLGCPSSLRKKYVGGKGAQFQSAEGKLLNAKGTEALGTCWGG